MTTKVELHACDICHTIYDSPERAERCEKKGIREPIVQVGDIVLASAGFGWFDGRRDWISNPDVALKREQIAPDKPMKHKPCPNGDGNCFSDCCTYAFYYVVTHLDFDDHHSTKAMHRWRYHLRTLAMGGEFGHTGGYTFDRDHIKPRKVEDPPSIVVETAQPLIGQKCKHLL